MRLLWLVFLFNFSLLHGDLSWDDFLERHPEYENDERGVQGAFEAFKKELKENSTNAKHIIDEALGIITYYESFFNYSTILKGIGKNFILSLIEESVLRVLSGFMNCELEYRDHKRSILHDFEWHPFLCQNPAFGDVKHKTDGKFTFSDDSSLWFKGREHEYGELRTGKIKRENLYKQFTKAIHYSYNQSPIQYVSNTVAYSLVRASFEFYKHHPLLGHQNSQMFYKFFKFFFITLENLHIWLEPNRANTIHTYHQGAKLIVYLFTLGAFYINSSFALEYQTVNKKICIFFKDNLDKIPEKVILGDEDYYASENRDGSVQLEVA